MVFLLNYRYLTIQGEETVIDFNIYEPDIISNQEKLIRSVLNSKVDQMIRYGISPKEDFSKEYGLDENLAFSLSVGSLVIEEDLFPIKADDKKYSTKFFASLIHETLIGFEIIKLEPHSPTYFALPREVGLVLIFSNKSQIILSHQLTKQVSEDFTVLEWEQIDRTDVYQRLYKTSCFWDKNYL